MNIKKLDTPNKALRGANIPDLIVDHIADGTYQGTIGWEQTPAPKNPDQVSSHFIIGRDGEVTQMVEIPQCAWTQGLPLNLIQKATLPIVRQRGINPNVYCVSIEHEGFYAQTHGTLTDAQLAASIEVHKFIISEVKRIYGTTIPADRNHIVGHYEINPVNKPNCPGELFPFDKIIAALNPAVTQAAVPTSAAAPVAHASSTITAPAFPLSRGQYFGPEAGGNNSISGYHSHRDDLKRWQQRMHDRGWSITVDGLYGNKGDTVPKGNTASICLQFETEKGLSRDSLIGPVAWTAAWTASIT
jgi:N-acetylmuramoyl-L-alanine amidase